jgi:hypothetical protein
MWPGWSEWAAAVVPAAVSWTTVSAMLVPLVLMGVVGLLAEWQRRVTLVALMRHAPGGTVVIQHQGIGGPPMWIWVGDGPRPPVPVLRDGVIAAVLPSELRP